VEFEDHGAGTDSRGTGAPLEIRWALPAGQNWAITAAALTSQLWLVKRDGQGRWQAKDVAAIGDPAKIPLPVDISITADAKGLWVNTFMDGTTVYFDLTDPEHPAADLTKHTGSQANMVSQSWDGHRVYITSSLLSKWTRRARTTSNSCAHSIGTAMSSRRPSRSTSPRNNSAVPHHMKFTANPQRLVSLTAASTR